MLLRVVILEIEEAAGHPALETVIQLGEQNPSFLTQNSSFLIHSFSFLIHRSSFLIQNSSFLLVARNPVVLGDRRAVRVPASKERSINRRHVHTKQTAFITYCAPPQLASIMDVFGRTYFHWVVKSRFLLTKISCRGDPRDDWPETIGQTSRESIGGSPERENSSEKQYKTSVKTAQTQHKHSSKNSNKNAPDSAAHGSNGLPRPARPTKVASASCKVHHLKCKCHQFECKIHHRIGAAGRYSTPNVQSKTGQQLWISYHKWWISY